MVCEGVLRYFGTRSEKIAEKIREQDKQIYLPQIEKLTAENNILSSEKSLLTSKNNLLTSENKQLKLLLARHNTAY